MVFPGYGLAIPGGCAAGDGRVRTRRGSRGAGARPAERGALGGARYNGNSGRIRSRISAYGISTNVEPMA
jgi:hypothetical protein